MAPPPKVSPVTGNPVGPSYIHASSIHFQDNHGRSILLRGVNLSGAAKNPAAQPAQSQNGFWEDAEEGKGDWINSTLNLDDGSADVHLARLRAWGFNMLRFVFTWEALEHAGPGKYDYEYMDYVVQVLYKCKEYGFKVFMDPHQDVWSRFSGGSGAPLWSIYACGIDAQAITPTYSALVQSDYPSRENPDPQSLPAMIWASNYHRAFNHTVWTLFFAGKAFAPKCIIDGVNIQDWLQDHFINAVRELSNHIEKAGDLYEETVLGWDSINEPGEGLIGIWDLSVVPKEQPVKLGPVPTPFQNMRIAEGEAIEVDNYTFGGMGPSKAGTVVLDPKGLKLWLLPEDEATRGGGKWGWKRDPGWKLGTCIWAQHGVWDVQTKTLLKPAYFHTLPTDSTHQVEFVHDFWRQYWLGYASGVRTFHREAIHFINTAVFKPLPDLPESFLSGRACATPHFYDGLTLMTKHWSWYNADALGILRGKYWSVVQGLRVGEANIRKCIQDQLGVLKEDTRTSIGNYPTLIGEIGCPYDMDGKKAYGFVDGGKGKGDYSSQLKAWDCSINANDGPNVLNYTLWTYVPNHSHEWSDNWNGEDLSLWSRDDTKAAGLGLHEFSSTDTSSLKSSTQLLNPSSSLASSRTLTQPAVSPKAIDSGDGVTAQLVLDGARAVAAFCRPYPVATVGRPERIDFDIKTTTFKLSVRISPEDWVEGHVMTEIYVPFVHYAKNLDWDTASASVTSLEHASSKVSLADSASGSSDSLEDQVATLSKDDAGTGSEPLKLDIQVTPSIGTYRIAGQYLYWAYPLPTRETVYTIEIKRNGPSYHVDPTAESDSWFSWCTVQ